MQLALYLEDDMSELEISDLSIGDWVMVDGEYWKVSAISSDSVGLCVDNDYAVAEINECDGILITPEILEKNGFVGAIDGDNPVRTEYVFKAVNIVGFADCDFYHCRIRHPEGWWRFLFPKIHYVHELQHALRFAGIEKEIEL